jgi:hypothetical protein
MTKTWEAKIHSETDRSAHDPAAPGLQPFGTSFIALGDTFERVDLEFKRIDLIIFPE